jgi:translation initiation factor 3 subunit M
MIAQVRDITKLSAEWNLTKEERLALYLECAHALDSEGDAQGAFNLYFHSLKLIDSKSSSKYQKDAEKLIANAIKGPQVIQFEEIMLIEAVQDLKKSSKELFEFVDLFLKADVAAFKKNVSKMNKLMETQKIQLDQAIMKKQYIDVCSIQSETISFKDLAKLLDIKEDDIEEWVIEAMSNDILDAKIDQVSEKIIIKTSKLRTMQKEEWELVSKKIEEWKQRFERIEKILEVQPETK